MPSNNDARPEAGALQGPSPAGGKLGERIGFAWRIVRIRMRFVVVFVVAFLIVGLWGNLRNYWDTWTYRLAGSHSAQHSISDDTEYFCPMDPGVVSAWPAICPVCNMDLIRRKKGEAVILPEGVVARMQFSPYRIQLAGIKTSIIGRQTLAREIVLAGRLIAAPDPILECEAYPGDLPLLTPERRAEVSIDGLPGNKPCTGAIVAMEPAEVATERHAVSIFIRLEPPAGIARRNLRVGMTGLARVTIPLGEIEPFASSVAAAGSGDSATTLAVPESAIVETAGRRVVYVETMPGMFDGVEVSLGPRCGDFFPVVAGLEPGQKVATTGAFLIDAEARLSRNLDASYFGAARAKEAQPAGDTTAPPSASRPVDKRSRAKPAPTARLAAKVKLSAADQKIVDRQKTCPVTGLALDSMGGPVAVEVAGRRVFICCKGCESKLKQDPQKYLAKLKPKE